MLKINRGIFSGTAMSVLLAGCAASGVSKVETTAAKPSNWSAEEQAVIATWPERRGGLGLDVATERKIAAIVASMTLEQKIGQMTQAEIRYSTPEDARKYYLGSILNGGGSWPGLKKKAKVGDWVALAKSYEQASLSTDMATQIPIVWGIDAVHGNNNVVGATTYPHNIGLGAAHDPALVERIGRATARAVRATGIGWAFAPTLAVVQNARWGRTYESYSSDPAEVARNGAALVRGLQGNLNGEGDVLASAKHFVGDGGTWLGVDQGENRASAQDLATIHGAGYYATLGANVQTVMVSYNSWARAAQAQHGKMHGNRALVTGVLKERLGFDGLVVSDWNAIEQVTGCKRDSCPQAVNAGVDLFMVPEDWKAFITNTAAEVRSGQIPMARIDDAVTRILRVKFRAGLFDRQASSGRYAGQADAVVDRPLAQEAVRKTVVLLKNEGAALPLAAGKRVLVVGTAAGNFAQQTGGWSITWQGDEIDNSDFPNGETLLDGLRRVYGAENVTWSADGSGFDPKRFDAVVAVLGETPYAEMKGDVRFPELVSHSKRFPADFAALDRVSGKGVPVVTVLYSGRPTYATDLINRSDAFIAGFLPGTEAGAIADLLGARGGLDFTARLSFAWPNTACPSGGEPAGETLFARGFGLSYRMKQTTGKLAEAPALVTCG